MATRLWQRALDASREKDREVIMRQSSANPADLIGAINRYQSESKGKPIRLPNKERFFVRDMLGKVSKWVKKFVEVGDLLVQIDPLHTAPPWAALRFILQVGV
jgi:hypothetical protein